MTTTVLLHPIALDAHCWDAVDLPDRLALDLPGHGQAPARRPVGLGELADHVADQVADHVKGPFHLAGLSLGGMVAQHVALRHPERVLSLVIACASPVGSREKLVARAEEVERLGVVGVADDYLERWFSAEALAVAGHPGVAYARSALRVAHPAVVASYWRAMADHDVVAELGGITVPTTVIAGARDASVPVETMKAVAERIPGARFTVIDGPHMLQLETPHVLSDVILEHIEHIEHIEHMEHGERSNAMACRTSGSEERR